MEDGADRRTGAMPERRAAEKVPRPHPPKARPRTAGPGNGPPHNPPP